MLEVNLNTKLSLDSVLERTSQIDCAVIRVLKIYFPISATEIGYIMNDVVPDALQKKKCYGTFKIFTYTEDGWHYIS